MQASEGTGQAFDATVVVNVGQPGISAKAVAEAKVDAARAKVALQEQHLAGAQQALQEAMDELAAAEADEQSQEASDGVE